MKRLLSLILTMLVLTAALAVPAGAEGGTTITFVHNEGEWRHPMLQAIMDDYHERTGNTVEMIYVPASDIGTWLTAQFAAGTEPDLVYWTGTPAQDLYANGKLVNLTPYLEQESAWTGKIWQDSFIEGAFEHAKDVDGKDIILLPTSATSQYGTYLFYNIDILTQLGLLDEMDNSYTGMLALMQKIKDAGYVPMSVMNSMPWNLTWMLRAMLNDLYTHRAADVLEKLDVITPNGSIDLAEMLLGVKAGVVSLTDPEMIEAFRIQKLLVPYINEDYNTVSWEYERYFDNQETVLYVNGSWYPGQYTQAGLTFNYGIMSLPWVDSGISEYGLEKANTYKPAVSGPIAVSQKCADEGRLDTALNFLQYLTDPSTGAALVSEQMQEQSAVKGVVVEGPLAALKTEPDEGESYALTLNASGLFEFSGEASNRFNIRYAEYLADPDMTAEEFAQEMAEYYQDFYDEEIEDRSLDFTEYLDAMK